MPKDVHGGRKGARRSRVSALSGQTSTGMFAIITAMSIVCEMRGTLASLLFALLTCLQWHDEWLRIIKQSLEMLLTSFMLQLVSCRVSNRPGQHWAFLTPLHHHQSPGLRLLFINTCSNYIFCRRCASSFTWMPSC